MSDANSSQLIIAEQEELAIQLRRQREERTAQDHDRAALRRAWDALPYAIEPGCVVPSRAEGPDASLAAAIRALAVLHKALAGRSLLDKLSEPPCGVEGEDRQAWDVAVDILHRAADNPAAAGRLLAKVSRLPFATKVRDWLCLGFCIVVEGRWPTGPLCVELIRPLNPKPASPKLDAGPATGQTPASKDHPPHTPGGTPVPVDRITQAIAIKQKHPDWTAKRIAEAVGCSEPNLSQSPRWRTVVEAIREVGRQDARREGGDRRGKDRGGKHRGRNMSQYADEISELAPSGPAAGSRCASCGDPAGTDADGKSLMHEGKPHCRCVWEELAGREAPSPPTLIHPLTRSPFLPVFFGPKGE